MDGVCVCVFVCVCLCVCVYVCVTNVLSILTLSRPFPVSDYCCPFFCLTTAPDIRQLLLCPIYTLTTTQSVYPSTHRLRLTPLSLTPPWHEQCHQ